MNKNLPQAVKVIRAALASSGSDPAAAVAHALDGVQLLVDPERSFGAVLRRTPAGGWAREHPAEADLPRRTDVLDQVPGTELEEQAVAWDQSCERARRVAVTIERHIGAHPAFQNVQVDKDRVLVALHIVHQEQWAQWRAYFGIKHDRETSLPYMVAGDGYRDGVRVGVVAYDLPEARAHALRIAKEPYELDGVVYDLVLPQRDSHGDVWFYQGVRTEDGMPLLSVDGRPERCSLANIVCAAGPLTPVTDAPSPQATPVTTPVKGGERA
ncbi:BN159_2729 family protein [Streptomyces sp. NPDC002952]|uniref:BN159_2729 family protein n=1 Tax=Streptomyces sp. NPDC002952 TaxID=3364673 RepID=UPI00369CEE00